MHFEDYLALYCLAMNTIEFVFGDGWKDQDHCGKCERGWCKSGWICPDRYEDLRWVFDWKKSFHAIAADLIRLSRSAQRFDGLTSRTLCPGIACNTIFQVSLTYFYIGDDAVLKHLFVQMLRVARS